MAGWSISHNLKARKNQSRDPEHEDRQKQEAQSRSGRDVDHFPW